MADSNSISLGFLLDMFAFEHKRGPESLDEFERWQTSSDIDAFIRTYQAGWEMAEEARDIIDEKAIGIAFEWAAKAADVSPGDGGEA